VIQTSGERVWFTHRAPRLAVKLEIKPGQIQRPPCLSPVEILRLPEILQVLVVGPDLDRMLRAFEEVPPFLEGSDDREHLLVVDLVVVLDQTQTLGVECDWMPLAVIALLRQDSAGSVV
jgi:hypothetical protein